MARLVLLALIALHASAVDAHETRPGLPRTAGDRPRELCSLLWKRPAGRRGRDSDRTGRARAACRLSHAGQQQLTPGAVVVRGHAAVPGRHRRQDPAPSPAWRPTITDVLVRVRLRDGRHTTTLVHPRPAGPGSGDLHAGPLAVAASYLTAGIRHILTGVDHLLFVLGLLLIVGNRWTLLKTITAFTVAHSITLAIATLGYASAPLPPLNAAIALSILFLGPEIVRVWRGETSLPSGIPGWWPSPVRSAARLRLRQRARPLACPGGHRAGAPRSST